MVMMKDNCECIVSLFSKPKTSMKKIKKIYSFNDPFDVNCYFANNKDMSKLFRIFCVAPSPKEILMWSYYGTEHKGYCMEYKEQDILNSIKDMERDGLCIIGNVDYKDSRAKQKSKLNAISEYSCAMKSHFRKSGNQMSGKWKSSYAGLLA